MSAPPLGTSELWNAERRSGGLGFHANLHEDKCGRPTEELTPARRAAANPLRSVLEDAKRIKKNLETTKDGGSKQPATFSSLCDLKAANEQPFWDETDSKISSEHTKELTGLAFSLAKVWPSGKGAKKQPAGQKRNL